MTARERFLTWTTLATLTCLVLLSFLRPAETRLMADDEAKAEAIGPASSVLLVEEDKPSIKLQANDGRLAWGDSPQQRTEAVAYVHIGALLTQLMQRDERIEERQSLTERLTEEAQVMIEELENIQAEIQDMKPEDEAAQEQMQKGQQLAQQLQAFRQQADAIVEAKAAEQLEACYRELVTAVNVVADRENIDTVFRFIPTDDDFSPADVNGAMLQIRLRTLLRYPEESDITEDVAEELNLDLE